MDANDKLTELEAAQYLGFEPQTLNKWRQRDRGPAFLRLGGNPRTRKYGKILYLRRDLDAFVDRSRVDPAAQEKDPAEQRTRRRKARNRVNTPKQLASSRPK